MLFFVETDDVVVVGRSPQTSSFENASCVIIRNLRSIGRDPDVVSSTTTNL